MRGRLGILGTYRYENRVCGVSIRYAQLATHTAAFPVHAGTCSSACGGANKFSRPQGQELHDSMMAIDAAETKVAEEADQYKICPNSTC
jgi:hypothetical protein